MGAVLASDDLRPGLLVIVLDGEGVDCSQLAGFPLKVVAVRRPFIVVISGLVELEDLGEQVDWLGLGGRPRPFPLDTRLVRLMRVDRRYVRAMLPPKIDPPRGMISPYDFRLGQ